MSIRSWLRAKLTTALLAEAPATDVRRFDRPSFDPGDAISRYSTLDALKNPDEVLEQFAGSEGVAFYSRILRQVPFVFGILSLRVDAALALPRTWVSAVNGDEEADRLRDIVEGAWDALEDQNAALRMMLIYAIATGLSFGELVAWVAHVITLPDGSNVDVLAPSRMIDRLPDRFYFTRQGELRFRPNTSTQDGVRVDPLQIIVVRSGSADYHGSAALKWAYPDIWVLDEMSKMALEALAKQGYPLLTVKLPESVDEDYLVAFRHSLRLSYPNSYVYRSGEREEWSFPDRGATPTFIGSDQIERTRQIQDSVSIGLIGVAFSQNKNGGSYARDKVASSQMFDKTAADGGLIDAIGKQFAAIICQVNAPTVAAWKRPRLVTDSKPQEDLDAWTNNVVAMAGIGMEIDEEAAAEKLGITLAKDGARVLTKTASPVTSAAAPSPEVVPPPPPEPPQRDPMTVMSEGGEMYELAEFDEANQTIKVKRVN